MSGDIDRQVLVVLGFIENSLGEILITRRYEPVVPEAHLKWDLVGGTVELGETPEETLIREIKEEVNLVVGVKQLIPKVVTYVWHKDGKNVHTILLGYKCEIVSGEAKVLDEKMDKLEFVSKDKFKDFEFIETCYPFFDFLD